MTVTVTSDTTQKRINVRATHKLLSYIANAWCCLRSIKSPFKMFYLRPRNICMWSHIATIATSWAINEISTEIPVSSYLHVCFGLYVNTFISSLTKQQIINFSWKWGRWCCWLGCLHNTIPACWEKSIVLRIKNELCPFLHRERERERWKMNKVQNDLINAMYQLISWMIW